MSHIKAKMHQIRFPVFVHLSLCPTVCSFVSQMKFDTMHTTHFDSYTRYSAVAIGDDSLLFFQADSQSYHTRTERKSPLHVTSLNEPPVLQHVTVEILRQRALL